MSKRALALLAVAAVAAATPLDDYCNKPDPTYRYEDTGARLHGQGWTGYVLNMTSQTWLNANETNRSVWVHDMVVIVPDNVVTRDHAFLWITGNGNHGEGARGGGGGGRPSPETPS